MVHKSEQSDTEAVLNQPSHPAVPDFMADTTELAGKIAQNMWVVQVTIKRPGGSYKIKGAEVRAENMRVEKTTRPGFIVDEPSDHPAWFEIDELGRQIEAAVTRYSINDRRRKGFHLVPASKTGKLYQELRDLRVQRLTKVEGLRDDYNTWVSNLRSKYPNHFHLLEPLLPAPHQLMEKFDVMFSAEELTPVTGEKLKFENIDEAEKQDLVAQVNRVAEQQVKALAKAVYDDVFGAMLKECDDIAKGALQTGLRKMGGITELVDMLERLKNFGEFATRDVLARTDVALEQLKSIGSIDQLNEKKGKNELAQAITASFKPLGEALTKAMKEASPTGGRARRVLRA